MSDIILTAFLVTTLAGLSTVLGAILSFHLGTSRVRFLPVGLGFSAGVMTYISFFELLPQANRLLLQSPGGYGNSVVLMFFSGLLLAGLIDLITHRYIEDCPHAESAALGTPVCLARDGKEGSGEKGEILDGAQLLRTGLFTAVVIAIHNFPEGIATFTTASADAALGIFIAAAIAIHNVPEGFCIALPVYYATGDRKKIVTYALVAGLAEPLGALLTYLILLPYIDEAVLGAMLASVAGIMVYVSFDELLPTARRYGGHSGLFGLVCGMLLMAFSLAIL